MSVLRRMSLPQRVVIVIALGLAMLATWVWWYSGMAPSGGGWFAYAPNTTETYFVVHVRQPEDLALPLALIGIWTGLSLWLLAPSRPRPEDK